MQIIGLLSIGDGFVEGIISEIRGGLWSQAPFIWPLVIAGSVLTALGILTEFELILR